MTHVVRAGPDLTLLFPAPGTYFMTWRVPALSRVSTVSKWVPPTPTQALATLLCSLLCPDASGGPGEARLKPKVKGRPRKHILFHMKPALSLSHVPT